MALRTFLALEIDDATRDALLKVQGGVEAAGAKVKWVERENLHVTMNFLGDVGDEMLSRVCAIAAAVAAEFEPFDFEVRGAVCVPPKGKQLRMIWAGVSEPTGALSRLYDKLATAFEGLGFRQEERAFKPHITLARVKYAPNAEGFRRSVEQWAQTNFSLQHADELVVLSSQLTADGPVYAPIARPKLGG